MMTVTVVSATEPGNKTGGFNFGLMDQAEQIIYRAIE
jgi:hypothetical protein